MAEERRIISDGVSPRRTKNTQKRGLFAAAILILLAVGVFAGFAIIDTNDIPEIRGYTVNTVTTGNLEAKTEASGTVVYPNHINIVSPKEAYAEALFAETGNSVTSQDVLAKLDVPDLEDNRNDYESQFVEAEITLEELMLDYRYSLTQTERTVSRLQLDIAEAEKEVKAKKELAQLKSSRKSEYENALNNLESLQNQFEDAKLDLDKTKQKREIALRKQEARINQIEKNLQRVIQDIEETRIKSPISGEVMSINENLSVPGSLITQNTKLFLVANKEEVFFDLEVYEQFIARLEKGAKMTVTIGTTTIPAEITNIGKVATTSNDGTSAMVTVRAKPIENVELTMGASAVASISLGVKEGVLMLPRGAYLTTGNQKYIYKIEGDKAYKTKVTFGEIQSTKVEITSGLEKGDKVITSGYSDFINKDIVKLKEK